MDVYVIEPGVETQWLVVKQTDGEEHVTALFVRRGEELVENGVQELTVSLKREIIQKFPTIDLDPLAA